MRLVFINADIPWPIKSGCSKVTSDLINRLSLFGEVTMLVIVGEKNLNSLPAMAPGIKLKSLSDNKGKYFILRKLASIMSLRTMVEGEYYFGKNLDRFQNEIDKSGGDILIFNHIRTGLYSPHVNNNKRMKKIYIAHNAESVTNYSIAKLENNLLKSVLYYWDAFKLAVLEKKILASVDYCVSLTYDDEERLRKLVANTNCKVITIPPIIDVPSRSLIFNKRISKILLVGSFYWRVKQKNVNWFVSEIYMELLKTYSSLELHIVGGGANQAVKKYSHISTIKVFSDVRNVYQYYDDEAVFVVPERQKGGVKIKAIEAAGMGMPIVSTPEGVEGTYLKHNTDCLIVNNESEFINGIQELIENQALRDSLKKCAKNVYNEHFTSEKVLIAYENLFK